MFGVVIPYDWTWQCQDPNWVRRSPRFPANMHVGQPGRTHFVIWCHFLSNSLIGAGRQLAGLGSLSLVSLRPLHATSNFDPGVQSFLSLAGGHNPLSHFFWAWIPHAAVSLWRYDVVFLCECKLVRHWFLWSSLHSCRFLHFLGCIYVHEPNDPSSTCVRSLHAVVSVWQCEVPMPRVSHRVQSCVIAGKMSSLFEAVNCLLFGFCAVLHFSCVLVEGSYLVFLMLIWFPFFLGTCVLVLWGKYLCLEDSIDMHCVSLLQLQFTQHVILLFLGMWVAASWMKWSSLGAVGGSGCSGLVTHVYERRKRK